MSTKTRKTSVPKTDNKNVEKFDIYENIKNKDNKIVVKSNDRIRKLQEDAAVDILKEEVNKLDKIKQIAGVVSIDEPEKKAKKNKSISIIGELKTWNDISDYEVIKKEKPKKDKKKKKKDKKDKGKKKDKKSKNERIKLTGLTIKEKVNKKTGKVKEISAEDKITKRFEDAENLTKRNLELLDETIGFIDDRLKIILDDSLSGKMRGRDRIIADYMSSRSQAINSRQSAAKDIISIRKSVIDATNKYVKTNDSKDSSELLKHLMPELLESGSMQDMVNNKKNKKGKKHKYDENDDFLDQRLEQLSMSGDYRSNPYDDNISYEGKYKLGIKYKCTTGDWKFIALTTDGSEIIKDFPKNMLPSKESYRNMSFDLETGFAVDKGRGEQLPMVIVDYL